MKMMLALAGVAVSAAALAVLVIVELLARLLPVLVLAGLCWVAFTVWRRTHRPRLHQRAAPAQPAPSPSPAPVRVLPPVTVSAQRRYPVMGADTGFSANRDDGYLRLNPPHVGGPSCGRRQPHTLRHVSRRRPQRQRTTRP